MRKWISRAAELAAPGIRAALIALVTAVDRIHDPPPAGNFKRERLRPGPLNFCVELTGQIHPESGYAVTLEAAARAASRNFGWHLCC